MAALQVHNLFLSSSPSTTRRRGVSAGLNNPRSRRIPLPNLTMINMEKLTLIEDHNTTTTTTTTKKQEDNTLITKLYAIAEAAADRAEMHDIIGKQRNNWGRLLLVSTNSITLTASIMAGISSFPSTTSSPYQLAFKLSSTILYVAATAMMLVTNKLQPSQLAEEQRNATRLFRQLEKSIHTNIALRATLEADVREATERVLALDKAYPLPLLPMLEKFPKIVKPTVWWPKVINRRSNQIRSEMNGWSEELEVELKGALRVLKTKDVENYLTLGRLVVPINRMLAISGPVLAGVGGIGASLIGSWPVLGPWPVLFGVVGGVLAAVVNALEHGGQVGMVFELARNCAGNYLRLEEVIEANLGERDVEKRENGELFEMKMALQLGRSMSEMKGLALYASKSEDDDDITEFAGKLF